MKIISWNCNMAFRKKAEYILQLNPDILVVPECEHPKRQKFKKSIIEPNDRVWIGDNETKGLGVFSYSDYNFEIHESYNPKFRYVLPLKVKGKIEFNLLAVWAMNDKENPQNSYISQVWFAVNYYKSILNDQTIIVGDFNSNSRWDKDKTTRIINHIVWSKSQSNIYKYYKVIRGINHTDLVEILKSKNIYSTYHYFFKENQGKEKQSTLYFYRKKDRPYHIDYCFASKEFIKKLKNIEVGLFEDWIKFSDHMPLVVDFED